MANLKAIIDEVCCETGVVKTI